MWRIDGMVRKQTMDKLKYYCLNIKHAYYDKNVKAISHHHDASESGAASFWLDSKQSAVIFFGSRTVSEIRKSKPTKSKDEEKDKLKQARDFIEIGDKPESWESIRFVTVQNGFVWIYRPAGKVIDQESIEVTGKGERGGDRPKSMPVALIGKEKLRASEVPYILASMRSNQAFSRGTFREIDRSKYLGNIAAIQSTTKEWESDFIVDPLLCLSSVELETLIAKLFEASDCFVPAYRGGTLDYVDLFLSPRSKLSLRGMDLECNQKYSVQIKLSSEKKDASLLRWIEQSKQHLLITLTNDEPVHKRHFGRAWLQQALNEPEAISVKSWLKQSLDWLPDEYQESKL